MITNKAEYREYQNRDMAFYRNLSRKDRFVCWLVRDPLYFIAKYVRLLRKDEFLFNTGKCHFRRLSHLLVLAQKNSLGNRLGFKIPRNCFGPGLMIYHHGEIIVNENARIGADCSLHGGNCIGNNGKTDGAPVIGDGLDLGIGAKIIGAVTLGEHVTVGANAVVTKSFAEDGLILVGIPARELHHL